MVWLSALAIILMALLRLRLRVGIECLWENRFEGRVILFLERWQVASFALSKRKKQAASTPSRPHSKKQWAALLWRVWRNHGWYTKLLTGSIHCEQLACHALLSTSNAAKTALLGGTLHAAMSLLPAQWRKAMRINILPDFFSNQTKAQLHCIFFAHLGNIVLCASVLLFLCLWEKRPRRES